MINSDMYEKIIGILITMLGAIMAVLSKIFLGRLKNLEDGKVDKDVLNAHLQGNEDALDNVLEELRASRKERREDFDKITDKVNAVHERIDRFILER